MPGVMQVGSSTNKVLKQSDVMRRHDVFEKEGVTGHQAGYGFRNQHPEARAFKAVSVGNMDEFRKKMEIRDEVIDGTLKYDSRYRVDSDMA